MALVLLGKDIVLEGSTTKIEDKQVPGVYIFIYNTDIIKHRCRGLFSCRCIIHSVAMLP